MAIDTKNRSELKAYFVKNSIPTEANFGDLIDGQLNQADDGVFKLGDDPLSIVAAPGDRKQVLRLYEQYPATNPTWTLSLMPRTDVADAATAAAGLGFDAPDGTNRLFLDQDGKLGLGTTSPSDKLTVHGGDLRVEGGYYRRLKVISDDYWAGIELVARNVGDNGGHPHIDFTHGDLDDPNYGVRLVATSNDKLMVDGAQLGIGRAPDYKLDVEGSAYVRGLLRVTTGLKIEGNRTDDIEGDGVLYRKGGQIWLTVDDNFYIRDSGGSSWGFHFNTDDSSLSAKGGVIVGAGNRSSHIDSDGAFYRKSNDAWITVGDHLYIRDRSSTDDNWTHHFNTDTGGLGLGGNLNVKGGLVLIGGWKLVADGEHLYFKKDNLTIARFSTTHDRVQFYRNRNAKAPYWYFNSNGSHSVHNG